MGHGAMGEVYEAGHARLPGRFAIKVLNAELAGSRDAFTRFCREAEIMSSLRHPHIVQIFDFNTTPDGLPYFVMEYLDGSDLERRLAQLGPMDLQGANAVVKAVSSALAAAHARGIVHRDLKPANIYLQRVEGTGEDFVKVLDFGISKVRSASARLSRGGEIYGTPQFMAPEQALGRSDEVDARTDQFSLASIAYEMLTGQSAFAGDEATAVLYRVVHENPAPLASWVSWQSPELQGVLDRALSKERAERFPSISEFARAFEAACADVTPQHPGLTTRATLPAFPVTPEPVVVASGLVAAHAAPPPRLSLVPPARETFDDPPPPVKETFVELPAETPPPEAFAEPVTPEPYRVAPGPAVVVDAGRVADSRALVVRRGLDVEVEPDWELSGSVDRVPVSGYRAGALAVVALALGALVYVKGWYRELPQDIAFLRENAVAMIAHHRPLPQPAAPKVAEAPAVEAAAALDALSPAPATGPTAGGEPAPDQPATSDPGGR